MTTQKQIDSAINRTFKRLQKIADRKDKLGYNPYLGIFYLNSYFYVTDSICMVKVHYPSITIDSGDNDTYYKVNVIDCVDRVRPLFNLEQNDRTERMTRNHNDRGIMVFDRFFDMEKPTHKITVNPKYLKELLDIFATNKVMATMTNDRSMIKLDGTNDFCSIEAVLMGVRK